LFVGDLNWTACKLQRKDWINNCICLIILESVTVCFDNCFPNKSIIRRTEGVFIDQKSEYRLSFKKSEVNIDSLKNKKRREYRHLILACRITKLNLVLLCYQPKIYLTKHVNLSLGVAINFMFDWNDKTNC